jgi:hypothetical protein
MSRSNEDVPIINLEKKAASNGRWRMAFAHPIDNSQSR